MKKITLLTVLALCQAFLFPGITLCDQDYTGQIFFVAPSAGGEGFFALDPVTKETRLVMEDPGIGALFDISCDGSKIVYNCEGSSGWALWVMRSDGTGRCELPPITGIDDCDVTITPAFSPVNEQIAFTCCSQDGEHCRIFVADYSYDGENCELSDITEMTDPYTHLRSEDYYPHYSPDGQFIIFMGFKFYWNEEYHLWEMLATVFKTSAVGGEDAYLEDLSKFSQEEIQRYTNEWYAKPKPVDGKIVFVRSDRLSPNALVTMDDNGQSEQILYGDPSLQPCASYSPDGNFISLVRYNYCSEQDPCHYQVFAIPENGGPLDALTDCSCPYEPWYQVWAPAAPRIQVVDVAFDFEDGTSDGQDIRINLDEDVCTINPNIFDNCKDNRGEWVKGVRSHPAALLSTAYDSEYHPGPMRVRARFEVKPGEIQSATVSADSAVFGNFGEQQANFVANGMSDWIEFTTDGVRPAAVALSDEVIQWKVKNINGVPSDWSNINKSTHRIYFLLAPGYPYHGAPFEIQREPWSDVLKYSAKWAAGLRVFDPVAEVITKRLYDSGTLRYDWGADPHYSYVPNAGPPYYFKLKKFLEHWSDATMVRDVNCNDMAMAVSTFSASLGVPMNFRRVKERIPYPGGDRRSRGMEPLVVNCIDLIGPFCPENKNTCPTNNALWWEHESEGWLQWDSPDCERPGGFGSHAFASLEAARPPTGYDATLLIDKDDDPDERPTDFDYVAGKPITVEGDVLYEGLRDHNNVPQSDPVEGQNKTFSVYWLWD